MCEYQKVKWFRYKGRVKNECAAMKYLKQIESDFPDIAEKYFDMKFENLNRFKG